MLDFDVVLGLDLHLSLAGAAASGSRATELRLPVGAEALLAARTQARADRDWAAADRLRGELRDLGVDPIDRADGTSDWRAVD